MKWYNYESNVKHIDNDDKNLSFEHIAMQDLVDYHHSVYKLA